MDTLINLELVCIAAPFHLSVELSICLAEAPAFAWQDLSPNWNWYVWVNVHSIRKYTDKARTKDFVAVVLQISLAALSHGTRLLAISLKGSSQSAMVANLQRDYEWAAGVRKASLPSTVIAHKAPTLSGSMIINNKCFKSAGLADCKTGTSAELSQRTLRNLIVCVPSRTKCFCVATTMHNTSETMKTDRMLLLQSYRKNEPNAI